MAALDKVLQEVTSKGTRLDRLETFLTGVQAQVVETLAEKLAPAEKIKLDALFAQLHADKGRIDTALNVNLPGIAPVVASDLPLLPPTTNTAGGALAPAVYYYVVTAMVGGKESPPSNEVSVATTGPTSSNNINWAAVPNATAYRVYRGTASGKQDVFYEVVGATHFVDTNGVSVKGAVPRTAAPVPTHAPTPPGPVVAKP